MTHLALLVETSRKTAATPSRAAKVAELAAGLRSLAQDEIEIGVAFLTGATRQGRIGASYTLLRGARAGSAAESPSLTLSDVDAAFAAFSAARGSGSPVLFHGLCARHGHGLEVQVL